MRERKRLVLFEQFHRVLDGQFGLVLVIQRHQANFPPINTALSVHLVEVQQRAIAVRRGLACKAAGERRGLA